LGTKGKCRSISQAARFVSIMVKSHLLAPGTATFLVNPNHKWRFFGNMSRGD